MLESEKTTLFILKVSTKPTGSSSFINEVLDFFEKKYKSQNFLLLAVAEKSNYELKENINLFDEKEYLRVFFIEAFANDNDTKGSGDIKGWMEVISSSGEFRYGLCEMK